jgi:CHAD domain-containing protein
MAENAQMKKNTLYKDIYRYSKKILLCCNKVSGKYNKNTIHKLRVNFKTLRALLRWQHAESKKLVTPFRRIYHVAGDIRNADLVLDFIVSHKIHLPACKQWLTQEQKKYRHSWGKVYHRKETEEWVHMIKASAIEYRQNDIFFKNKIKESRQIIMSKPLTDEDLHQIRKKIKHMQYTAEWSSKQGIPVIALKNHPVEQLKEMATRIGDYNDLGMVTAMLELFLKENKHSVEAKKVALIRTQCLQKKRKEKSLLVRYIKDQFPMPHTNHHFELFK